MTTGKGSWKRILVIVAFVSIVCIVLYYLRGREGFQEEEQLVFYIPHYRSSAKDVTLLNYCVRAVQLHYPSAEIIICETPSTVDMSGYDISGVKWLDNPIPNSSSIGCFKDYLSRYKETNTKAVFINDNMILKGEFVKERLDRPFGFTWFFTTEQLTTIREPAMEKYVQTILEEYKLDTEDYAGCLGNSLFGTYSSIERLWNAVPFEQFMEYKDRKNVLQDIERIIGITAFGLHLVDSIDTSSLCGSVDHMPNAFLSTYTGQTFEELQRYPYGEACIKLWSSRTMLLS